MLRSWLARPLYRPESIRERQDAVAGLKVRSGSQGFCVCTVDGEVLHFLTSGPLLVALFNSFWLEGDKC